MNGSMPRPAALRYGSNCALELTESGEWVRLLFGDARRPGRGALSRNRAIEHRRQRAGSGPRHSARFR